MMHPAVESNDLTSLLARKGVKQVFLVLDAHIEVAPLVDPALRSIGLHFLEKRIAFSPCFAGVLNFCVFGIDPERTELQGFGADNPFASLRNRFLGKCR